MLKNFKLLAIAALALLLAAPAMATISGSAHDFSALGWSDGEICKPCHTPHNANTGDVPLWSHDDTTATHTTYDSGTMDATTGAVTGISLACLSCHDGTVALEAFQNAGTAGPTYMTGDANFGTDLSNDHPISFTYDDTLATTDGELHPPTTTASGLGSNIDVDLLFGASNDQMECASCHDVHNTASSANSYLLLIDNDASALCLTCHDK